MSLLQTELRDWWVLKVMKWIEDFFIRKHISPNAITYTALLCSFLCFLLYATGHILWAAWMVLLTGSLDILDGRVARATNQVTRQGEFLDSTADRYQDFFIFAGLCVFYRSSWILMVVLLALGGSMVVSYVRSKADNVGVNLSGIGTMQRPERIFMMGFGSMVSSALQVSLMPFWGKGNHPPQHILICVLIFMAVSANWTAVRRIQHTLKALSKGE